MRCGMIELSQYGGDTDGCSIFVNPDEIAVIRPCAPYLFGKFIGGIVLRSGIQIQVWETVEEINSRIQQAQGGDS